MARIRVLAVTAAIWATACTTVPPVLAGQDVEFMRGCWVEKQTVLKPTTFLRLLSLPDDDTLRGWQRAQLTNGYVIDDRYSFERNGSRATLIRTDGKGQQTTTTYVATPAPDWIVGSELLLQHPHEHFAVYASQEPRPDYLVIQGSEAALAISVVIGSGGRRVAIIYFNGERDGCD